MHPQNQNFLENVKVVDDRTAQWRQQIEALQRENERLNLALMRKSAEASEAQETLKRWRLELELLAEQKGHNLCWMWIPRLLKATLGHTGKYPDPEGVTREDFAAGCVAYQEDLFGKKEKEEIDESK